MMNYLLTTVFSSCDGAASSDKGRKVYLAGGGHRCQLARSNASSMLILFFLPGGRDSSLKRAAAAAQ